VHNSISHHIARIAICLAACSATLAGSQSCPVVLNGLLVTKSGSGSGVVTSVPSGISCGTTCNAVFATDATITLTAKADAGSVFAGWSGMCSGVGGSVSIGPLPVNAGCTASFTSTTPSTGPSGAHPRLWLSDSATFTRITAAAKANSAEWARLKNICDTQTQPGYDYQGAEGFRMISNFALCYRVVKANSGDAAAAPYGQKAVNLLASNSTYPMLSFTAYSTDSGYGIRNYVPAMAIAYDWLHDYPGMTTSLKSQVATRMKAWLTWYEANGYGNGSNYISNYNAGFMVSRTLAAIALYNEDSDSAALWSNALAHYNGARQSFDSSMPGGHWPEGWSYGSTVYQNYGWAASALRIATNDASYLNFNWLTNNVLFKANALTNDGKFFYVDGVWNSNGIGAPSLNDMIVVAHALGWGTANGQIARNYINRAIAGGETLDYPLAEWTTFLFYDPASQPANMATAARSNHAIGNGVVTMRSDWTTPTATWGSFVSGRYLDYQQQDHNQGHMEIHKGALLLMNASPGYYGGGSNTFMQNTYTLEKRTDSSIVGQDLYTSGCPNPSGSNPIGINAYSDNGGYLFTSGEFSAAYQIKPAYPTPETGCGANAVTWLNRSTLYVRPGLFVVYDQVQKASNQAGMVPTMHLHFPTQATAQGGNNRQVSLDNGPGRLQVVTVLPATSNSTLQGEAANVNSGPGQASWHLKVAYTDPSAMYQKFLTVMRAGQSTSAYTFPNVSAISGTSVSGSYISGLLASENATPIAVVFAEGGAPRVVPATLQYQYPSGSATQNYVAKLKANAFYTVTSSNSGGNLSVTVAESASGTKTDGAGVLAFTCSATSCP
jgi:Divergent InlB B-repeat domain